MDYSTNIHFITIFQISIFTLLRIWDLADVETIDALFFLSAGVSEIPVCSQEIAFYFFSRLIERDVDIRVLHST
jgi:hypothetical protein